MNDDKKPSTEMKIGFQALLEEDYKLAEDSFMAALKSFEVSHTNRFECAACLNGLGQTFMIQMRLPEAENFLRQSLKIYEDHFPEDNFGLASILTHLASIYFEQKKFEKAEILYAKALPLLEKVLGEDNPTLVHMLLKGYEKNLRKLERIQEANCILSRIREINEFESDDAV